MTAYQQNREIAWREVDGEAILVDPLARQLRVLNPAGTFLWAQLEAPRTAEELAALLTAEFDVTAGEARRDVEGFLAHLLGRKLVREVAR